MHTGTHMCAHTETKTKREVDSIKFCYSREPQLRQKVRERITWTMGGMGDSGKDKGKGLTERTQKSSKEAGNLEKSEQGIVVRDDQEAA